MLYDRIKKKVEKSFEEIEKNYSFDVVTVFPENLRKFEIMDLKQQK